MQLKESSYVNIVGRLDEDVWEDPTTHEKRSAMVVILDEIEYCFSGGNKQKEAGETASGQQAAANPAPGTSATPIAEPSGDGNFTGYEPFGGVNSFFDE